MNKEDLQQIANLLNPRFDKIDSKFDEIDSRFDKIDLKFGEIDSRFDKLDKRVDNLELGITKLDKRVGNLEQGQDKIINNLDDFRKEVKDDQEYTHRRIDQSFINISEQMTHSFTNERRIKHLEGKKY